MSAAALVEIQQNAHGLVDQREDFVEAGRLFGQDFGEGPLRLRLIGAFSGGYQILHALEAVCCVRLHALADGVDYFRGYAGNVRRKGGGLGGAAVGPTHGGEGTGAGEHLKKHRAAGIDVRRVGEGLAHDLFGRHVGRGSHGDAHGGAAGDAAREAEVH